MPREMAVLVWLTIAVICATAWLVMKFDDWDDKT
jgi:hypothetical protein